MHNGYHKHPAPGLHFFYVVQKRSSHANHVTPSHTLPPRGQAVFARGLSTGRNDEVRRLMEKDCPTDARPEPESFVHTGLRLTHTRSCLRCPMLSPLMQCHRPHGTSFFSFYGSHMQRACQRHRSAWVTFMAAAAV